DGRAVREAGLPRPHAGRPGSPRSGAVRLQRQVDVLEFPTRGGGYRPVADGDPRPDGGLAPAGRDADRSARLQPRLAHSRAGGHTLGRPGVRLPPGPRGAPPQGAGGEPHGSTFLALDGKRSAGGCRTARPLGGPEPAAVGRHAAAPDDTFRPDPPLPPPISLLPTPGPTPPA